jgi:hypothetical protein
LSTRTSIGRLRAIDIAVLEELAGDPNSLVDVAAGVAAQVEDQGGGAGLASRRDRRDEVIRRVARELLDADIGDLRAGHERPGHRWNVDLGPDDAHVDRAGRAGALDRELDRRSGIAPDLGDNRVDILTAGRDAVDLEDRVTTVQAGLLGGAAGDHDLDDRSRIDDIHLGPDPDDGAAQR